MSTIWHFDLGVVLCRWRQLRVLSYHEQEIGHPLDPCWEVKRWAEIHVRECPHIWKKIQTQENIWTQGFFIALNQDFLLKSRESPKFPPWKLRDFPPKLKDFSPKLKVLDILLCLKPQDRWKKAYFNQVELSYLPQADKIKNPIGRVVGFPLLMGCLLLTLILPCRIEFRGGNSDLRLGSKLLKASDSNRSSQPSTHITEKSRLTFY